MNLLNNDVLLTACLVTLLTGVAALIIGWAARSARLALGCVTSLFVIAAGLAAAWVLWGWIK